MNKEVGLSREETEEIDARVGRIHKQFRAIEEEMTALLEHVKGLEHRIEQKSGITREQAEQAFRERYKFSNPESNIEIRSLAMEEIDAEHVSLIDNDDPLGPFEITNRAWRCTFEIRYRELNLGVWTGRWKEWLKKECYIVEPMPGPYVID